MDPKVVTIDGFQSTLPYGERPGPAGTGGGKEQFQSTLPYGERLYPYVHIVHRGMFQSTLPYGERHICTSETALSNGSFNPRSRMGSDLKGHSVHAPV